MSKLTPPKSLERLRLAAARRARQLRDRRWVLLRKAVQTLAFLGFLYLFAVAHEKMALAAFGDAQGPFDYAQEPVVNSPAGWLNLPMRLDPLAMLAQSIAARRFAAGASLALLTVALTLAFGRTWCGWLCPLGTLLDWITPGKKRGRVQQLAIRNPLEDCLRSLKYLLLMMILSMAFFGSLTLMIFDPITLLYRSLASALWPALDRLVTALESGVYPIRTLQPAVLALDGWLRPAFLPYDAAFSRAAWLFGGVLLGVIALNWLAPRFWCRYLCPLGGLLGLLSKFALVRRVVDQDCKACQLCLPECPTGTIDPQRAFASDPAECTVCLECLPPCPRSVQNFKTTLGVAEWMPYDPNRRQALAALGGGALAVALFSSDYLRLQPHSYRLRPPGATEDALLANCIRCGACLRVCPTSGLQAALSEAGLEGLWTPILTPRLGYCDYSCNACGQVCPTQAIPPLAMVEKRQQEIGKAYIDEDHCLAWADHIPCIVCEEMCPLPEKAIWLEQAVFTGEDGSTVEIQLPHMARERCIGCGICEYQCPLVGEAAIRVFTQ